LSGTVEHHAPSGNYDIVFDLSALGCPACSVDGSLCPTLCSVSAGWASATDDVWFVGNRAFHFDGTTWTIVPTPGTTALSGVWGSSRADVYAVGDRGAVLHYDGVRWSSVASPATTSLAAVWTSGPCDVWMIGDAVYHAKP
jgi:hypothetical protein